MREKKKLLEEVEAERIQAGKIQEINEEKKRAIEVRNQVFVARLGERKASLQKTSKSIAGNS